MAILRRKSELGGIYPYKVYLDRKLGWEWEFFFPACDIEDDGEGPPRFTMHDPFERIDEVLREAEKKDVPRAPVIAACALQHAMKAPGGVLWRGHDLVSSIFRPEIAIVPEPENPRYVRMTWFPASRFRPDQPTPPPDLILDYLLDTDWWKETFGKEAAARVLESAKALERLVAARDGKPGE